MTVSAPEAVTAFAALLEEMKARNWNVNDAFARFGEVTIMPAHIMAIAALAAPPAGGTPEDWKIEVATERPFLATIRKPDGGTITVKPEGHVSADEAYLIVNALASAMLAASPQPPVASPVAWEVKPLEWIGDFAHTGFGLHYYLAFDGSFVILEKREGSSTTKSAWPNRDEARAAAQADYETRIRSVLIPAPPPAPSWNEAAAEWHDKQVSRYADVLASPMTADADDRTREEWDNNRLHHAAIAAELRALTPPATGAQPKPFDLVTHLHRQIEWSRRTFGPASRAKGVVAHIRKELFEIEAAPTDLSEWVDVVILALDGAWRAGYSPEQIVGQIVAKQTKNEGRVWPDWRQASEDQAIEHDRSTDAATGAQDAEKEAITSEGLAVLEKLAAVARLMDFYVDEAFDPEGITLPDFDRVPRPDPAAPRVTITRDDFFAARRALKREG